MITVEKGEPTFSVFPNNEINVTLPRGLDKKLSEGNTNSVDMYWKFENNDEILKLALTMDLLETYGVKYITVDVGYMPYTRMDRHEPGKHNSFSLKKLMKMLPYLEGKDTGVLYRAHDVHNLDAYYQVASEATIESNDKKLFGDVPMVLSMLEDYITKVKNEDVSTSVLIILPDKGSVKRYSKQISGDLFYIGGIGYPYVYGSKVRDFVTHTIKSYELFYPEEDKPLTYADYNEYIIIDDVVSYGNTFINLANSLKLATGKNNTEATLIVGNAENALWRGDILTTDSGISKVITASHLNTHSSDDVAVYKKEGKND